MAAGAARNPGCGAAHRRQPHAAGNPRLGVRPGIEAVGYVDDLASMLDRCRASVAPLRYGAGAKGKVAESLARGCRRSARRWRSKAWGCSRASACWSATMPGPLADSVVELLRDDAPWRRLSEAGWNMRAVTSRERACPHREMLGRAGDAPDRNIDRAIGAPRQPRGCMAGNVSRRIPLWPVGRRRRCRATQAPRRAWATSRGTWSRARRRCRPSVPCRCHRT